MDDEGAWVLAVVVAALAVAVTLAVATGVVPFPAGEDRGNATVRVYDGDRLVATVAVEVADTRQQRYRGLSGTERLENGTGMLFVHDREQRRAFVMRDMNYGLDMLFVGADRRINAIRHAPPPGPGEDGNDIRRTGRAMWVLEVPRGFANATGISAGDRIEIEYDDAGNLGGSSPGSAGDLPPISDNRQVNEATVRKRTDGIDPGNRPASGAVTRP
jgi:hypothetical protein